jgi:L-iditol 2-dehydrogenase
MKAAVLYGPKDLRLERVPLHDKPGRGMALVRVLATGICGTDLNTFQEFSTDKSIVMGHEFIGVIESVGPEAMDGYFHPLQLGARVAVDPAQSCGHCDRCEKGDPNLCENLHFVGLYPDNGSLCQFIIVQAHSCFPLPDSIENSTGVMLEPLGVAIHATDLAHIHVADSVAILGAGPIGLCILQLAKLSGASPIFITDKFTWRLEVAKRFGVTTINCDRQDPVEEILKMTNGRGVDVAIEVAWADKSIQQAVDVSRLGGRLVLVGIPHNDQMVINASTCRRKGLTMRMCRRMKHAYPRAIRLAQSGQVNLSDLVSHHFPLNHVVEAFTLNSSYSDDVLKVIIDIDKAKQEFKDR